MLGRRVSGGRVLGGRMLGRRMLGGPVSGGRVLGGRVSGGLARARFSGRTENGVALSVFDRRKGCGWVGT
ncbi:hypothetical protein GCM10010168_56060 [Actinoplanes ianthinogenes]|uniref:Uncharacterized protein n=1 Tax=Actinoplanes ianthinogenes TaxID=122358 RepID=A0ABM7LQ85_9ACTN|nr:hypothetical protein Aiant_20520 [Actinoplanes ianthinogenes]GGR30437.1 hypothetical protein GCM10010168_56060 [Actinoplanes ianthinogenes]